MHAEGDPGGCSVGSHSLCAGGDAAQSLFTVMLCFKLAVKYVMKYHSSGGKLLSVVCFSLCLPSALSRQFSWLQEDTLS